METQAAQVLVMREYSDNDILSEEEQNQLMYWRDVGRMSSFDIGDITARIITRSVQSGLKVSDQRIFEAVSHFCGNKPRTVRYCYETAVFYNPEIRQQYNILPFSHFVAARTYGEGWQDFLDLSMLHPGSSVEYIQFLIGAGSPVAAEVLVSEQSQPCAEIPETEIPFGDFDYKKRETSQAIPPQAQAHHDIQVITAIYSRLPDLAHTVRRCEPGKFCETSQRAVLDAVAVLLRHLPDLAKSLV